MSFRFKNLVAGALIMGTAFASPAVALADDDNQELGAYLYETSCDALKTDAIIEDLGDLEVERNADKEWARLSNGQDAPTPLWIEDEDIDQMTVDDLVATPHAVAIHASDSEKADVIACGDITGEAKNGTLLIEIAELDDSGFEGRAFFAPEEDDDDDELEVTVGAWATGEVDSLASPSVSTPAS